MRNMPTPRTARLLAAVLAVSLAGCGARYEVAKDKVLAQIDKLLGEVEVQKKQVEIAVRNLRKSVDTLAEGKNRARVQADLYGQKVEEQAKKIGDLESHLTTLRGQLKATPFTPVVLAGKTYNQDDLKALADRVVQAHKAANTEVETLRRSRANLDRAATALEDQHRQAKARLAALEGREKEFEAKMVQLKVLREARVQAGDADRTLAASFADLERQMDDLHVRTEAALRTEEERWKDADPRAEMAEVEKVVNAGKGVDGTLDEIDRILGKK